MNAHIIVVYIFGANQWRLLAVLYRTISVLVYCKNVHCSYYFKIAPHHCKANVTPAEIGKAYKEDLLPLHSSTILVIFMDFEKIVRTGFYPHPVG